MTDHDKPMSMVEIVARAIYEGRNGTGCIPWSRRGRDYQRAYLSDARAAISAMREPTEGMVLAMFQAWEVALDEIRDDPSDMTPNWQAAIDAALTESK